MHQVLKNIKTIRKIKGLSQDHIAAKLGITQSSYARFENQGVKIDLRTVERVAEVLETDLFDVFNYHNGSAKQGANGDFVDLTERLKLLEKYNQALEKQLVDKEEIINYLKKQLYG